MENNLWATMPEAMLAECAGGKYQGKPIPVDLAKQAQDELARRKAQEEQSQLVLASQIAKEQAKEAREAMIAKIAKSLDKVWTDDLSNVLITREETDDVEHGQEVEVTKPDKSVVREMRYPRVKTLVVRTNIFWTETKAGPAKSSKSDGSRRKLAIQVFKRNGNQLELVGNFRSGQEACDYLNIPTGTDDAKRVLDKERYIHEPYDGVDYTVAK